MHFWTPFLIFGRKLWPQIMPGKVLKVLVENGENVDSGTPLLVIESMKMENVISSNKKGKVQNIFVGVDDNVQYDQPLVEIS